MMTKEQLQKEAGDRIHKMRMIRDYTRETLAELAAISSKFLYEIEVGKKCPSADVLYRLCEVLQVKCDYILTGRDAAKSDQRLLRVLDLYSEEQTEQISHILEEIYKL